MKPIRTLVALACAALPSTVMLARIIKSAGIRVE